MRFYRDDGDTISLTNDHVMFLICQLVFTLVDGVVLAGILLHPNGKQAWIEIDSYAADALARQHYHHRVGRHGIKIGVDKSNKEFTASERNRMRTLISPNSYHRHRADHFQYANVIEPTTLEHPLEQERAAKRQRSETKESDVRKNEIKNAKMMVTDKIVRRQREDKPKLNEREIERVEQCLGDCSCKCFWCTFSIL
jgi:hypothetical protein